MVKMVTDSAMLLAAGMGTRMRHLTKSQPKPLVKVSGKALVDYALDHLEGAEISEVVINVHYLADKLVRHLANRSSPRIKISCERDTLLETGGGMVNALPLLRDPFFALNSDNIWFDTGTNVFELLSAYWEPGKMDALLLVLPRENANNYNGAGDFSLDANGKLIRAISGKTAPYVFTGIQLVSHNLMKDSPKGPFSTNVLWDRAIKEGRLFGVIFDGKWYEVGSPEAVAATEEAIGCD